MTAVGRTIALVSGIIMVLTCLLYILSNALPSWGSVTVDSIKQTFGLWRLCRSDTTGKTCVNLVSTCKNELPATLPICHKMLVARAFVTIACIISAVAALCLFLCAVIKIEFNRIIIIISKVLPFVSLIAGIIGVAVGIAFIDSTSSSSPNPYRINDAAILGITAVAVNTIGAILALMIR